MNNNEILKADLLDILFEHRNKSYGAYALRRYYNNRLLTALGVALSSAGLFFLISFLSKSEKISDSGSSNGKNVVTITQIDIEKPKEIEPVKPKKPETVAQKDFQTIKIVEDDKADKPIVDQKDLTNVAISNRDEDGIIPVDASKAVSNPQEGQGSETKEPEKETVFVPFEKQPSFPGGPQALALFFSRTLSSPADLEAGEKKMILVRFVVGADGSITKTEIVQSGGDTYDKEVLRAFKRMPKWDPAIQNGTKVATTFTQAVTFVGADQ
ncbi:MAG: TonB family protein [Chitinophagaceae bacterium]